MVYLTYQEHFVAHWLLARLHGGKMSMAFTAMCNKSKRLPSRLYERYRAEGMAARSADPKWRKNQLVGAEKRRANPLWRERQAVAQAEREKDPEYVERRRLRITGWQNKADWRKNHTTGVEIRTADPTWRAKHRANLDALTSSPEWREGQAERNRAQASDPKWREANAAAVRRTTATPEWKEKHAEMAAKRVKPVIGTRLSDGQQIILYGASDITRAGFHQADVTKCCNDERRVSHAGYAWHYASPEEIAAGGFGEPEPKKREAMGYIGTPVAGGLDVLIIGAAALVAEGFDQPNVTACCKGRIKSHRGYRWRVADPEDFNRTNWGKPRPDLSKARKQRT